MLQFTAIQQYNALNGKTITAKRLKVVGNAMLKASKEGGTIGKKLKSISIRIQKIVRSSKPTDKLEIELKPIVITKNQLGKIAKDEPLRTKQLRAMFARLANGGENLKKDKPEKNKKPEPEEKKQDTPVEELPPPTKEEKKEIKENVNDYINDISKDTARNAFNWTSFHPEKRGETFRESYVQNLIDFRNEILPRAEKMGMVEEFEKDFDRFREKMKKLANAYLYSHSNVASSMITGPSNFPVERNRKRSNWADNKYKAYSDYDKFIRSKLQNKYTPDEQKPVKTGQHNALEILENRLKQAEESHKTMIAANKIMRSKKNVDERLKEIGLTDKNISDLKRASTMYNTTGYAPFYLQNNNAEIKRLKNRIEEVKKLNENRDTGNKTTPFKNGKIVENFEVNRLQLLFDEKPDDATRTKLKKSGFKWSPRFGAWQRQLTNNARWNLKRLLPEL